MSGFILLSCKWVADSIRKDKHLTIIGQRRFLTNCTNTTVHTSEIRLNKRKICLVQKWIFENSLKSCSIFIKKIKLLAINMIIIVGSENNVPSF